MRLNKKPTNSNKQNKQNKQNITLKAIYNLKEILKENEIALKLGEVVYLQAKEKIENKQIEYISEGKEGTVYKIEIEMPDQQKKILLAVKRRFDGFLKEEIRLQHKFFEKSIQSKTKVKVPEVFGEIDTNDGKYFLMEYIEGKTLFTLKMEKIAERFYEKIKTKYLSFFEEIKCLNKHIDPDNINKRHTFHFSNDTEARNTMYKIISFLNEQQESILKKYTNTSGIVYLDKKTFDTVIEKIYNDNSMEVKIFRQNEGRNIQKQIQNFLYECHQDGLYHKDLGGNPTNLMFIQKDHEEIIPVIIDFGKSEIHENYKLYGDYKRGEGPYGDEHETYIPDTDICYIINGLTEKPPKKEPRELRF